MHIRILSPACLTVLVKSKTENQIIRFVTAYFVADHNVQESRAVAGNPRDAAVIFDP